MYNEIYGAYYHMMRQILTEAGSSGIAVQDIHRIVAKGGFAESSLYFTPNTIEQDGSGYNLLTRQADKYCSVLKHAPAAPLTTYQRRLIKTMLTDKRIRLFLDENEIKRLEESLADVLPLYDISDIVRTETAADGDDYTDEQYRTRFQTILRAVKQNTKMKIVFDTSCNERKTVIVVPYKIEYGLRDDKFRLCAVTIRKHQPSRYVKLNIARIKHIFELDGDTHINCEAFIAIKQLKEPVEIEVSDLRNGFERIFTQLSNYKRTSTYDPDTQKCRMQIHCMDDDVQELLIVLMSFGPAIKVIGPNWFREEYVKRIKRQMDMLKAED